MICEGPEYRTTAIAKSICSCAPVRFRLWRRATQTHNWPMREQDSLWVGRRRKAASPAVGGDHIAPMRRETPLTGAARWEATCYESASANALVVSESQRVILFLAARLQRGWPVF